MEFQQLEICSDILNVGAQDHNIISSLNGRHAREGGGELEESFHHWPEKKPSTWVIIDHVTNVSHQPTLYECPNETQLYINVGQFKRRPQPPYHEQGASTHPCSQSMSAWTNINALTGSIHLLLFKAIHWMLLMHWILSLTLSGSVW